MDLEAIRSSGKRLTSWQEVVDVAEKWSVLLDHDAIDMTLSYSEIAFVTWITTFLILSALCLVIQVMLKELARRSIMKASDSVRCPLPLLATPSLSRVLWKISSYPLAYI